ncbi:hypothetical protein EWM64_g3675 [Hericium alpestre]|uniref:Uncharacterized protein n=1 Tax=Hericium alpestre TaxID=135208 RepID=A0A4Z0A1Z7_9AGAM|nr:hypothetical protein EWM64_g3675 [Hericium alpestre]
MAEVDALVKIRYSEASSIAEDFLSMSVPPLPFQLALLSGPLKLGKSAAPIDSAPEEFDIVPGEAAEDSEDEPDEHALGSETTSAAWDFSDMVATITAEAARDSVLLDAHDADDAAIGPDGIPDSALPKVDLPTTQMISRFTAPRSSSSFVVDEEFILQRILDTRHSHQSLTGIKSQQTIMLDPKFSAAIVAMESQINTANEAKLLAREGSYHVRLAQDLDPEMRKPKTDRELHWQGVQAKRVTLLLGGAY